MLKVLSCGVHDDLLSVVHCGMNPRVSQPPEGPDAQEDTADDGGIELFLLVVVMFWEHDLTGGISKSL